MMEQERLICIRRSQATFSGSSVPGGAVNVTCIGSQFNTTQINIRNLSDIN